MAMDGDTAGGRPSRHDGRSREDLVRALGEELRTVSTASAQIGHRFAALQALHERDFRALTLVYGAENEGRPLTASALAAALGLTSGAVTYLVERLVASGHVRRDHDPADRRKVILRYSDHGHAVAADFFGPLGAHTQAALRERSDEEIAAAVAVLADVVGALRDFDERLKEPRTTEPRPGSGQSPRSQGADAVVRRGRTGP